MGKPSAGAPGATSLEEASMAASGEAVTGDLEMAAGTLAPAVSRGLSAPISAPAPAPVAVASVSKKDVTNFGSFKVHFTPLGYTEYIEPGQFPLESLHYSLPLSSRAVGLAV